MQHAINLTPPTILPSAQTAFDIFQGEWVYEIPIANTKTGSRNAFKHLPKIVSLLREHFPNHANLNVFEMGPHEGEHSFHLHHLPVKWLHAVEARTTNFLKCLIVKNELRLDRVYFGLGNAVEFLRNGPHFDLAYCCGVLYHLPDPIGALKTIASKSDRLVMTTAVFNEAEMRAADERTKDEPYPTNWLRDIETSPELADFSGFEVSLYRRVFRDHAKTVTGHGGVNTPHARLLTAEGLLMVLERLGGQILHYKAVTYPRAPEVECIIRFR